MKQKTQTIKQDLTAEFNEHVNLYNLIGQAKAKQILKVLIDEYHWSNTQAVQGRIRPVLIYGRNSCSTLARAVSNSIGNTEFTYIEGRLVGYGMGLTDHFRRLDEHITYYIPHFDKMVYYHQQPLYSLVRDSMLKIAEVPGYHKAQEKHFSGMVIISAQEQTKITEAIAKHCSAVIQTVDYNDSHIQAILEQRITLYGLSLEEQEKFIDAVVNVVSGDVRLAIKLLWWSVKCCRAEGQETITLKHLNKALKMWG